MALLRVREKGVVAGEQCHIQLSRGCYENAVDRVAMECLGKPVCLHCRCGGECLKLDAIVFEGSLQPRLHRGTQDDSSQRSRSAISHTEMTEPKSWPECWSLLSSSVALGESLGEPSISHSQI